MNAREKRMVMFRQARERVQAMNTKERERYGLDPASERDEADDKKAGAS